MSDKVYAYDDFGNKHETLTKEEIEQSIGAGGIRECVLTGCINYNNALINYNYTGTLPSESIITKLLAFGVNPVNNLLTEAEVTSCLSLSLFSIHFYYLDAEIYVTNANGDYLAYSKMGEGTFNVYPRKVDRFYFVKANEKTTSGEYVVETAVNATNAKKADHATIAQYASEDTSKGTIDDRLNSLGFKEGTFTFEASGGSAVKNSIKKQGKYAIGNLIIFMSANTSDISIRVPDEFKPKENTPIMIGFLNNDYLFIECRIKTDGTITTSSGLGEVNGSTIYIVNAGWEIA